MLDIPRHTSEKVLHPSGIEMGTFDDIYNQEGAPNIIYNYHRTSFYHIFRCGANCKDQCIHYVEDNKLVLYNSLLIINRDISHKYSKKKCIGKMILFTDTFLASTHEKTAFLNRSILFQNNYVVLPLQFAHCTTAVDTYFSLMEKLQPKDKTQTTDTIILRNLLHNLLMTIEREYRQRVPGILMPPDDNLYMQQFKALLDEHYSTKKQVGFYAAELRISEKKLSQIVHDIHGLSAKTYINEKILSAAILLLNNTTLTQGEIAQELGFDAIYFIKFFRKYTGLTPTKYRQQEN